MHNAERHLSPEDLLLLLDREMTPQAASSAEEHLSGCEDCSALLKNLSFTLKNVDEACRINAPLSHSHRQQRAALQMRLQEAATRRKPAWRWTPLQQPLLYGAALLLIATLSVSWSHDHAVQQWTALVQDRPVPNPELTPGAVRAVDLAEICPAKDEDKDPAVTAELQEVVFEEYGVAKSTRGRDFQVDYLINPQLGGTGEIRNLWPQPYKSTPWNALAKDALEDRLHAMVCDRQIELSEAQREIATDWIGAYKRHFHTETPLPETAGVAQNDLARLPGFITEQSQ